MRGREFGDVIVRILALLLSLIAASSALTATIQVAAVTSPDQWTLGAGADKVVAVNSPNDNDTSYIACSVADDIEQYSIASNSIPVGSSINSASVYTRCKSMAGGTTRWVVGLKLAGTTSLSGYALAGYSYADNTTLVSRPGGGNWNLSDLTTLEVLIKFRFDATRHMRCTSLWLIVDYSPPPSAGNFFEVF